MITALERCLDSASNLLRDGDYHGAFAQLGGKLSMLHDRASDLGELDRARATVRGHDAFATCQQDPYTHRAFVKPRGYAGDAVMLDYVYEGLPPSGTTPIGTEVFRQTTRGPMGLSVLFRRNLLSAFINDAVARNPHAAILSVASGHCREVAGSFADSDLYKGRFIAFDQDGESCAEVDRCFGRRVTAEIGSIKRLISGRSAYGDFDLIYSAGLYDYLTTPIASKLSATLFAMLRPGGCLVAANFCNGSQGRGYMDWMMDWQLLYRRPEELAAVSSPDGASARTFLDPHQNVVYAVVRKQ